MSTSADSYQLPHLWYADGPVSALGLGGYYQTTVCGSCGRAHRNQVGELKVELITDRAVWFADNDSLLISERETECLNRFAREGARLRQVTARWRYSEGATPKILQVTPTRQLNATNVRWSTCECNAVEHIAFNPLQLRRPSQVPSLALVAENASTILMCEGLRDLLTLLQPDLQFSYAYWDGEYREPKQTFTESDWSDLA
jgi:hypothetical protein